MATKTGRYSGYIRPFSYLMDLIIINTLSIYMSLFHSNIALHVLIISFAWSLIAVYLGFYDVYRYTKVISILNKTVKQAVLFGLFCLTLELYYSEFANQKRVVLFVFASIILVISIKLFIYYFLRRFRVLYGGNFRTVVLLGDDANI